MFLQTLFNQRPSACCEDTPTKVLYDGCHSVDLDLHTRSQMRLKLDYFLTCNIANNIYAITFTLGMAVELSMPHYAHARSDDLDLDAKSLLVGKGNKSALHALGNQGRNKY